MVESYGRGSTSTIENCGTSWLWRIGPVRNLNMKLIKGTNWWMLAVLVLPFVFAVIFGFDSREHRNNLLETIQLSKDACVNKEIKEECSFDSPRGLFNGTCENNNNLELFCKTA
jgi:hypothetical protein